VKVNYDYDDCNLKIQISDTGIGISEEDRVKLFTLFGKLEATA
jgi:signal transduction histidine kinase